MAPTTADRSSASKTSPPNHAPKTFTLKRRSNVVCRPLQIKGFPQIAAASMPHLAQMTAFQPSG
jgi:hypothetical protein